MSDVTASDVLRKAAGIVEEGWDQGAYFRSAEGTSLTLSEMMQERKAGRPLRVCAIGAVTVAGFDLFGAPATRTAEQALAFLSYETPTGDVVDWNDTDGRTASEVAAAMIAAADRLDGIAP